MKIKPLFLYLGSILIIVLVILIVDSGNSSTSSNKLETDQQSQMPNDDIHQNLGNAPGSGNVSKEFKEKMSKLKTEYESNPSDTINSKEYARLLAAAHEPEKSVDVYNSILTIDPERNDIRLELATVYYNLQQYNNAKSEILKVYEEEPNSPGVQYNLGAIEAALGNIDKAKSIWQDVINKYPDSEAAEIASTSLKSLQ